MGIDITGLGSVADLATTVIGKIWPDKSKEEQAQLAAALTIIQGQMDTNKVEAGSASFFTSGARPFIMWVCGVACAWNWIGISVAKFVILASGHPPIALSPADVTEMMPLLFGMLGLGGLRTFEKFKGVA